MWSVLRLKASPCASSKVYPSYTQLKVGVRNACNILRKLRELKLWNYEVKDIGGNAPKGRFVTYRFK